MRSLYLLLREGGTHQPRHVTQRGGVCRLTRAGAISQNFTYTKFMNKGKKKREAATMNAMPAKLVRITELLANAPVEPEAHLDTARVGHYAKIFDALPPIVVFDTAEGLLLADGYHRVAAARRRGLETAIRRDGGRRTAWHLDRGGHLLHQSP